MSSLIPVFAKIQVRNIYTAKTFVNPYAGESGSQTESFRFELINDPGYFPTGSADYRDLSESESMGSFWRQSRSETDLGDLTMIYPTNIYFRG